MCDTGRRLTILYDQPPSRIGATNCRNESINFLNLSRDKNIIYCFDCRFKIIILNTDNDVQLA